MALVRIPTLPLEFAVSPDMEIRFSDLVMVQFTGQVFLLSIFQTPLPIYGDQAAADAARDAGNFQQARCVARYALPMGQAEVLANTLREQLDQIKEDMAKARQEGQESK
jgi:hypothetical protein